MTAGNRRRARAAAFQMLYQWEVGRVPAEQVPQDFVSIDQDDESPLTPINQRFADGLVAGTVAHVAEADALIGQHAKHWRIERIATVDRLIMRLAIFELLHTPETSPSVVINEALELAKTFSEDDAVRFVNGVLDAVHKNRS